MGKIKKEPKLEGAPEWITTFVDMISLLVTFFILLFTFSSIQEYDSFTFKENILGTRGTIHNKNGPTMVNPPDNDVMYAMDVARGGTTPHTRPADKLAESLEEMGQKKDAEHIEFDPRKVRDGLVIHFDDRATFRPGSIEINSFLMRAIVEFARTMENYNFMIVVEGYTDTAFKPTTRYPTPEALSSARASAVTKVFLDYSELSEHLLMIAGNGMANQLNENLTPIERTANRRVEVRILAMDQARAIANR